jgi:hypothetical protein
MFGGNAKKEVAKPIEQPPIYKLKEGWERFKKDLEKIWIDPE